MVNLLKIENLTKIFSKKIAVDNLNLEIEEGLIVGFLGHNGAGKTTTIKSIVGLLQLEKGKIYVNGIDIKESPVEYKKYLFYLPDNPELFDFLSGIDYLKFISNAFNLSGKEIKDRIDYLAKLFEIENNLSMPISTYSHGMKQKIALISAFMVNTKLIILDEPFVGLDPKSSFTLKSLMKKHCENGGSIFFSTHVLEVAEKLCDKLAIISHGKLIKFGITSEIIGDKSLENVFLEVTDENTSRTDKD